MSLRQISTQLGAPLLFPGCDALIESVRVNQNFLLSAWGHSVAATRRYSEAVRPVTQQLMQSLLLHVAEGARMDQTFLEEFLALVIKGQPPLRVVDVLHLLADFEEMLVSLSCQVLQPAEIERSYHFAHELTSRIAAAVGEFASLPIGPSEPGSVTSSESPSCLCSLLRVLGINGHWPWLAVVRTQPEFRVIDFASFDESLATWMPGSSSDDPTGMVAQAASAGGPTVLPSQDWQLISPDVRDPLARALCRQLGRWLRISLAMVPAASRAASPGVKGPMRASVADSLLEFDEHLLAARDVSEVLSAVATDICKVCGFRRSALFLYNPLTESVEGIYGHHLELDEIRQIRESVRSIPMIHQVTQFSRTLYFSDASQWLPKHYVHHFHLTSLLAGPIHGPYGQAVGVLLLDQAGKPFRADEAMQQTVDRVLQRTTLALQKHLNYTGNAVQPANHYALTPRELDILQLIAEGLDTSAAAKHLHISDYTVTEHISAVFRKLQVKNRTQAVAKALCEGIIR